MFLIALLSLCIPAYAHYRLSFHGSKKYFPLWVTHLLLVAVGLGFGWAMSSVYTNIEGQAVIWTFILAFSAVHVPAAIILWLKKQRKQQLK